MSSKQMGCGHTCQLHLQNTDISHVTRIYVGMTILKKGLHSTAAMSNRGPVEGFVRPSLCFHCSGSILHTDNLSLF